MSPRQKEVEAARRVAQDADLYGELFGSGAMIADYRLLKRIERLEAYIGLAFTADDLRSKEFPGKDE